MDDSDVQLRPTRADDLWLFERQAVDPEAVGSFNWSGYKDPTHARRQFDQNGLLGPDAGRLVVSNGGTIIGDVAWSRVTYGLPTWWCWNIGISLLPEYRHRGLGTAAQSQLVRYLFGTTPAERIEAYTDVQNKAEQRALEKVGFTRDGVLRSTQFRDGQWCDLYLYSLLRHELETGPGYGYGE
ncbi:GNAT family N-acetyltransferase [Micromonospora sp. NPDC050417]|uniref:GNAT family N-acetyltransferase n=1 Tax=Micromonospora sp. NPDC050417 TaxID=3364280 RepID=UPI00379A1C41